LSGEARVIAANQAHQSVWIISTEELGEGNVLANYDLKKKEWIKDPFQPRGAVFQQQGNYLAVDWHGNPAFIDRQKVLHWRKTGHWIKFEGCASCVAFDTKGALFKCDCNDNNNVYKYSEEKRTWKQVDQDNRKIYGLAVTETG